MAMTAARIRILENQQTGVAKKASGNDDELKKLRTLKEALSAFAK